LTISYIIFAPIFAVLLVKTFKQVLISGKIALLFRFQSSAFCWFCISLEICRLALNIFLLLFYF